MGILLVRVDFYRAYENLHLRLRLRGVILFPDKTVPIGFKSATIAKAANCFTVSTCSAFRPCLGNAGLLKSESYQATIGAGKVLFTQRAARQWFLTIRRQASTSTI